MQIADKKHANIVTNYRLGKKIWFNSLCKRVTQTWWQIIVQ